MKHEVQKKVGIVVEDGGHPNYCNTPDNLTVVKRKRGGGGVACAWHTPLHAERVLKACRMARDPTGGRGGRGRKWGDKRIDHDTGWYN